MRKPVCAGIAAVFFCAFCAAASSARGAQGQVAATDGGQAAPGASSVTPSASGTVAPAKPAAKVWTNDDLSNSNGGESAVSGSGKKPKAAPKAAAKKNPPANSYQSQIAKLQAQLPPIDTQIANLQAALSGQPVNSPRKYVSLRPDDWQAQLVDLQKKKSDILSQIDALEDQARHAGVATNALP